jgi:hypothetical protein
VIAPPEYNVCFADGRSSDTQFILDLIEAYGSYNNNLAYDGFAGDRSFPYNTLPAMTLTPGVEYYNSNSFVAGLLVAAGKEPSQIPDPWGAQPGLNKPILLDSTMGSAKPPTK